MPVIIGNNVVEKYAIGASVVKKIVFNNVVVWRSTNSSSSSSSSGAVLEMFALITDANELLTADNLNALLY